MPHPRTWHHSASAILAAAALALAACTAAPPPVPRPPAGSEAGPGSKVRASEPSPVRSATQITEIVVRETAGASRLEVVADRPLVWTSYRNAGGDYVLELVGAEPAAGVVPVTPDGALIARLELEVVPMLARAGQDGGDAKRMTRITVHTRSEAAHALRTVGTSLRLTFTPAEAHAGRAPRPDVLPSARPVAPPPAIASEDLTPPPPPPAAPPAVEISSTDEAPAIDDAPIVTRSPPSAAAPATATALPDASPADALLAIEAQPQAGGRLEIRLIGNGTIAAGSPFSLREPARLVLDLPGLVNRVRAKTLHVGSPIVDQLRLGQFRADPPVTRVVLDLADPDARLDLLPTADGLLLTVERP